MSLGFAPIIMVEKKPALSPSKAMSDCYDVAVCETRLLPIDLGSGDVPRDPKFLMRSDHGSAWARESLST
jgi:hypothetical protein